jgi:hypothetical protein
MPHRVEAGRRGDKIYDKIDSMTLDENYFGQHDELENGREAQDHVPLITSRTEQLFGPTAFSTNTLQNATELPLSSLNIL